MSAQNQNKAGNIEVICGSMFAGKTELLIKRIEQAKKNNLNVWVFKPKIDIRYNKSKIVSHDKNEFNATPVIDVNEIVKLSKSSQLVVIDEAQFFDKKIIEVCIALSKRKIDIILAGLDLDYLGNPFGPMPKLMKIANKISHLHAICDICKKKAYHTYRKTKNNKTIFLGEKEEYLALCKKCFKLKMNQND